MYTFTRATEKRAESLLVGNEITEIELPRLNHFFAVMSNVMNCRSVEKRVISRKLLITFPITSDYNAASSLPL